MPWVSPFRIKFLNALNTASTGGKNGEATQLASNCQNNKKAAKATDARCGARHNSQ